jgi:hypothetical protein
VTLTPAVGRETIWEVAYFHVNLTGIPSGEPIPLDPGWEPIMAMLSGVAEYPGATVIVARREQ